jgi:glutamate formiminotransferase
VVALVGEPGTVERAAVSATRVALEPIDLRDHRGVHPRLGAVDVLPFVPLHGTSLADAAAVARRAGSQIAEMGVPPPGAGVRAPEH